MSFRVFFSSRNLLYITLKFQSHVHVKKNTLIALLIEPKNILHWPFKDTLKNKLSHFLAVLEANLVFTNDDLNL